jgi:hypothetical protein
MISILILLIIEFLIKVILDSVLKNILILELNMIPTQVSLVWTFMLSWEELEREFHKENINKENSENSKKSQLMKPNNGLLKNVLELLYEQLFLTN